jgi:anthranilate phosphoribosyltransferase
MDEVSLGAATMVGELVNGEVREYEIHPEDYGLQMVASRNLKVSGAAESKKKIFEALDNKPGPVRDIVALNAGTAMYAAGIVPTIDDGLKKAGEMLASGAARDKLNQFVKATQQIGAA